MIVSWEQLHAQYSVCTSFTDQIQKSYDNRVVTFGPTEGEEEKKLEPPTSNHP